MESSKMLYDEFNMNTVLFSAFLGLKYLQNKISFVDNKEKDKKKVESVDNLGTNCELCKQLLFNNKRVLCLWRWWDVSR